MSRHIIKTEYLKLKGNTSFKVFTIFFLVFLPVIIFTFPSFIKDGLAGANTYPLLPRNYETTWYITAYIASWFSLFILSFILIFHITNEYTYKTVRQNIIDGYSRLDFFKSKFYMLLTIAVIATVYVLVIGFVAGIYFQTFEVTKGVGFGSPLLGIESVLSYFVQVLAYLVFAIFIGFLLKKGAISVIVFFSLFLLEKIAGLQLASQNLEWLSDNLPLRTFSLVLPNPDIQDIIFGLQSVDTLNTTKVIMTLVYVLIFLILTRVVFYRRDVA